MDPLEIKITNTITDIPEKEWTTLTSGSSVEQSYAWYKTVEDSSMFPMHYVFLKDETLQAAACASIFNARIFNMDIPVLEVSSPLGLSKAFFSETPHDTALLLDGLQHTCIKEKAKGISISELTKEELNLLRNYAKGFTDSEMPENTYIDLNFTDFDDYLSSLDEPAWRSARMTLNRARRWKIKTVFTEEFTKWKSVAHALQGHLCEEHKDYRWHLPEKFYEALEKNMKEKAELLLFFKDDTPLASAVALNSPDVAHYKFAGIDPKYRKYQAYFLIYYEGIKRAIEKKQKRIYFGITTYEFKDKIGCKREPLFGLVKMENPLLNLALKSYLAVFRI